MNPALIAALVSALEQGIPVLVGAYRQLKDAGLATKTIEELLAQANANDDAIIAAAQKELNP